MGKYDNVTAKELHEKREEMLNSLGRTSDCCDGVRCLDCPISYENNEFNIDCESLESNHFGEYVKIIMEYKE